jgi:prophage antirepressor-like protein
MNDMKIFNSNEFGDIRTDIHNGEPMFCLSDVCKALGLTQPSKVKERLNEKGVRTIPTLTAGGEQKLLYINESNLYKTIFQSRKESAERFTDWVTSEVLPAIRKTGTYQKPMSPVEMMRIQLGMIDDHEGRITDLEQNMTLDYGQQMSLGDVVNRVVVDVLGGKDSNAYHEIGRKVFAECNRDLKHYFNVNARNNVPKKKFDEAIDYVKNWQPCTNTRIMIQDCNAQMRM